MERLDRSEIQRFTATCPGILAVFEAVLGSLFDEQGARWTDTRLRIGGAMSAVELASHSRLQTRRAVWHAAMVLMTLRDAAPSGHDAHDLLESLAAIAHTLSLTAIACDSEVASAESVAQARIFIHHLPGAAVTYQQLVAAHHATFPDDAPRRSLS